MEDSKSHLAFFTTGFLWLKCCFHFQKNGQNLEKEQRDLLLFYLLANIDIPLNMPIFIVTY